MLECWDRETKGYVAVKVIRAVPKYSEAALVEVEVLRALKTADPTNQWRVGAAMRRARGRGVGR